jgi:hypothetical protein
MQFSGVTARGMQAGAVLQLTLLLDMISWVASEVSCESSCFAWAALIC